MILNLKLNLNSDFIVIKKVSLYELESIKFDSKYMAKELKKWAAPDKLPFNLLAAMDSGYVEKVPYGLVLILGKILSKIGIF